MGLKIYVSSTFEDLKDYRRRVYDQLRALRHDVIAMEDYVAADERPLDKCLRDVRDSDVYIGLFAWRYGYVPRAGNRGSTVTSKFRPFLEGLSSAGAGLRAATVKVLWWHVCNSHPQT